MPYLWVADVVHEGVNPVLLVVPDNTHSLLSHSTLVRVTR